MTKMLLYITMLSEQFNVIDPGCGVEVSQGIRYVRVVSESVKNFRVESESIKTSDWSQSRSW